MTYDDMKVKYDKTENIWHVLRKEMLGIGKLRWVIIDKAISKEVANLKMKSKIGEKI